MDMKPIDSITCLLLINNSVTLKIGYKSYSFSFGLIHKMKTKFNPLNTPVHCYNCINTYKSKCALHLLLPI